MDTEKSFVHELQDSLTAQPRVPNLGRWLSSLENNQVLGLALTALNPQKAGSLHGLVSLLMASEGLYRSDEASMASYTERLGWSALAEYAYRMDWATINQYPSLTYDARETSEITALGAVMMTALGPASEVVRLLSTWSLFDRVK